MLTTTSLRSVLCVAAVGCSFGMHACSGQETENVGDAAGGRGGATPTTGGATAAPGPCDGIDPSAEEPEVVAESDLELLLDFDGPRKPLEHIWRSTGFTPARELERDDMKQTIALLASTNQKGMLYNRPHFLLDLVDIPEVSSTTYDWSRLDGALDVLVNHDQKLIFEIMGRPGGIDFDFSNDTHLRAWKELVRHMAEHLVARYGAEEVRSWYFETWNEPNQQAFWTQSISAFLNYYDACDVGLKEADPALRFGGPGAYTPLPDVTKQLLAHVENGVNYFTGQRGSRMDFVSLHVKELPERMVQDQLLLHNYLVENHPSLAKLPHINDEADPTWGWNKELWWRAHPWYAAFVAQSAHLQFTELVDRHGLQIPIQSNDNGFLGTWGMRTHFARFESRGGFSLVKKPVYTVLNLMAMLGDRRLDGPVVTEAYADRIGVLASTFEEDHVAILLYHRPDIGNRPNVGGDLRSATYPEVTDHPGDGAVSVSLDLRNLPFPSGAWGEVRLDEKHGNPYGVWLAMGTPDVPTKAQLMEMRAKQDPVWVSNPQAFTRCSGQKTIRVELPPSSVSLVLLARKTTPPDQVAGLSASVSQAVSGDDEVVLTWTGLRSRSLRTYEVLYAEPGTDEFQRISVTDFLDSAFIHMPASPGGSYRVRAVDLWGRAGELSDVVTP